MRPYAELPPNALATTPVIQRVLSEKSWSVSRLLEVTAVMVCAPLLFGALSSCGIAPVVDENGRVYHCVGMTQPIPPPNTFAKIRPVEKFDYGDYHRQDTPTVGGSYYCNGMRVPKTAYLRYRVDDRLVEKHFDLTALSPKRVHNKTIEFLVDEEVVEVRLISPVAGHYRDTLEVILRQ